MSDDAISTANRKKRHDIMRALQRADWALQEDDADDALEAVLRAVRLAASMDSYLGRPNGLSKVLGNAVEATMEADLGEHGMCEVLAAASPLLILQGEDYKGCNYGM